MALKKKLALIFCLVVATYWCAFFRLESIISATNVRKRVVDAFPSRYFDVVPSAPSPESPLYVLVLSSMPRSGSTLLAEVLSNIPESVLFFEPLWIQREKECINDEQCVEDYVKDSFKCNYMVPFENWLKSKPLFVSHFNSEALNCTLITDDKDKKACLKDFDLRGECQKSSVRLAKVIRARIRVFIRMLRDPEANFKLIHLTRDPRGSLTSINKFGKSWNKDPHQLCGGLQEDMETFEMFKERYPTKVLQVSYEKFCLDPLKETKQIFQFLLGHTSLPPALMNYLSSHMSIANGTGSMSTYKNSKSQYEAWRSKIKVTLLKKVEGEPTCLQSIKRMKHTVFGSQTRVSNLSIPLFL